MAITKQDCLILLSDIGQSGIDCSEKMSELIKNGEPTFEILKFINDNRQMDVTSFYEKLRKSYNHKKSKLYINIMKEETLEPKDVLTTLGSLLLQILLYNKESQNSTIFLKNSRFSEINKCLSIYEKTGDFVPSIKLLKLVKADIKALESIQGRMVH